jgi:hypothetical protein
MRITLRQMLERMRGLELDSFALKSVGASLKKLINYEFNETKGIS